MPHIHNQPGHHDSVVTAFIFRLDFNEPKLILHKHKKLNSLLPFGGHIETNEDPWQAVEHEILEESGYELSQLKILQPKSRIKLLTDVKLHPMPVVSSTHSVDGLNFDHYHTDLSYAFVTNEKPNNNIDTSIESDEIKYVTHKELNKLTDEDIFANAKEIADYMFKVCLTSYEPVDTKQYSKFFA